MLSCLTTFSKKNTPKLKTTSHNKTHKKKLFAERKTDMRKEGTVPRGTKLPFASSKLPKMLEAKKFFTKKREARRN